MTRHVGILGPLALGLGLLTVAACERPGGCYELAQLGQVRADQYLVNRCDGRVWHLVSVDGNQFLVPVPFADREDLVGSDLWKRSPVEPR